MDRGPRSCPPARLCLCEQTCAPGRSAHGSVAENATYGDQVGRHFLCLGPHPGNGFQDMWIVRLALRRPYTFVVMALLIAVMGVVSAVTMTVDIFPAINIPVITVIWTYSGLSPTE